MFSSAGTSSFFGTQPAGSTQAAPKSSLFASQQQNQQFPGQNPALGQTQQEANETETRPDSQSTQPAFFNSLLERGRKRPLSATGQSASFEELPTLQLGLDDIRRKARQLGTGEAKDSQHGADSKA